MTILPTHLTKLKIEERKIADSKIKRPGKIKTIKKNDYCVVYNFSIRGEAPKSYIRVYEYSVRGRCRKSNSKTWILYIAKTGNKWYPIESITEHLIARIGQVIGLDMAHSRLAQVGTQVRFLSKYFLLPDEQELVHGTTILGHYINDLELIKEIAVQKKEREYFTLEETIEAIKYRFPDDSEQIFEKFFLMLFFDAWVGVQDRHFENWGVVRHLQEKHRPYFSPIYDSARGLFWSEHDRNIDKLKKENRFETHIDKQIRNSLPQFCTLHNQKINHSDLVEYLWNENLVRDKNLFRQFFSPYSLNLVLKMVKQEFSPLMSENRLELILLTLTRRHEKIFTFL